MSSNGFTYVKPKNKAFFKTLLKYLKLKGENEVVSLLTGARCRIDVSSSFSRKRWDAYWASIRFYVPIERLTGFTDEVKERLRDVCEAIMPTEAGYDVMAVEFSPFIEETISEQNLVESLDETLHTLSQEVISQLLPTDVKERGKDMAEVYLYLYCVENSLRLFIEHIGTGKLGNDYFGKLELNKGIKENITRRKEEENKNRWLRVRGNSEVFYLDFDDLGTVIQNNWGLFSQYFPDQNWIVTKIKELASCRNLVAHNSYVQSHEKDVIRTSYVSILRQLNETLGNQKE